MALVAKAQSSFKQIIYNEKTTTTSLYIVDRDIDANRVIDFHRLELIQFMCGGCRVPCALRRVSCWLDIQPYN